MLFNSYGFIFLFLPVSLFGFFLIGKCTVRLAAAWLIVVSFIFYAWWQPHFLPILIISLTFNYSISELIRITAARSTLQVCLLGFAVSANLAGLAYYKYLFQLFGFLNAHDFLQTDFGTIVLPLGISFITFIQISYLVDQKQGASKRPSFLNYALFATFFPHLIAGPILRAREILPQLADVATYRFSHRNLSIGITIFVMGLLKKVVLADPLSAQIGEGFEHARNLAMLSAWDVALSYSLQLYFDFSGYSDMAIGCARMFNIRFPVNFASPYKATSIIDFWQRWHITLTRFVTLYIYNPIALAVTRWRVNRRLGISHDAHATIGGFSGMMVLPTFSAIVAAGIWHGAGLQFLLYGLVHAFYLTINHAWRIFGPTQKHFCDTVAGRTLDVLLTYVAVVVSLVLFRTPTVGAALDLLGSMAGMRGMEANSQLSLVHIAWLLGSYLIIWVFPNTQEIMHAYEPALEKLRIKRTAWLVWHPNLRWGIAFGIGTALAVLAMGGSTEFLYFRY